MQQSHITDQFLVCPRCSKHGSVPTWALLLHHKSAYASTMGMYVCETSLSRLCMTCNAYLKDTLLGVCKVWAKSVVLRAWVNAEVFVGLTDS
jgi:hypothetical protein